MQAEIDAAVEIGDYKSAYELTLKKHQVLGSVYRVSREVDRVTALEREEYANTLFDRYEAGEIPLEGLRELVTLAFRSPEDFASRDHPA